jgi:hypothetical protein
MTEMTQERKSPAELGEQSATEQAKDKVQEAAGQVQQQVGEKAQQVRGQAADGVRQQLDSRSTQAGEQLTATADALRRVSQQLQESNGTPAQYAKQAAEPVERLGRYLTQADGDRILRDAERFARRRPLVTVIGGATLGFLVARFIKASGTGSGPAAQSSVQTQAAAALPPPSRKDDSDGQSDN